MYSFELIEFERIDLNEYYSFANKTPFTTIPWLKYLMTYAKAEPVIVRITKNNLLIGYFTGLTFKKFGVKIFGSPFEGWGTCYMGFDLYDSSLIKDLLRPTIDFVFAKTKCLYFELVERNLEISDLSSISASLRGINHKIEIASTLEVDINKPDAEFLKSVKEDCRRYIRQFEKRGGSIEIAEPSEAFADEIYDQLKEVFAKQNLVPTHSVEKIKIFLKNMRDSGMLLCLTIREPLGKNIASIIFTGLNKKCFVWFMSSYREFQYLRPNEYIIWYGLRSFRDRGYEVFDFAGVTDYKYKWNPRKVEYLRIMAAKYPGLIVLRDWAKRLFYFSLKVRGFRKKKKVPNTKKYKQEKQDS